MSDETPAPSATVTHVTPGRIRFRVAKAGRSADSFRDIESRLAAMPGVESVSANPGTGSVLIKSTAKAEATEAILDDIDEIGTVLSFGMGSSDIDNVATQLGEKIAQMNRRVYDQTGENLHLGQLIPVGMAGLGIWQTIRTGIGLELVPGPLILWLAWDIYRAYGKANPGEPANAD